MATPFGKAVRKIRIDRGLKLKDMADALGMKSAYLSAVEMGKRRITERVLNQIIDYFDDESIGAELRSLVDVSQPEFVFDLADKTDEEREMVVAFARKFSDLMSPENKDKFKSMIMD